MLGERACAILAFLEQMDFSKVELDRKRVENIFNEHFNAEKIPFRWADENDEIVRTQGSAYYYKLSDEQLFEENEQTEKTVSGKSADKEVESEPRYCGYSYRGKEQGKWAKATP